MISTLISYSREDSEFASRLASDLRAAGTGVSLAPLDGSPDARERNAVESALGRCTDWLVILSPSAVRSANLGLDVAVAVGRQIPIVAILCRDCEIPARLKHLKLVDFRTNYATGFQRLLATTASAQHSAIDAPLFVPTGRATTEIGRSARADPVAWRATSDPDRTPVGTRSGWQLRLLGGALLALSVTAFIGVTMVSGSALDTATAWATLGIGLLIAFLPALAGVKFLKRGKQRDATSAAAALARDARPPVVYLRSFQDDAVASEGSLSPSMLGGGALVGGMVAILNLAGGVASEEEQLAEALSAIGPFVAVGKPGERLPQLGAARMYVQNSEWKEVVRGLMSRAGLVVLRAGRTDGLWWEVQTAAEIVRPERIVFLLPYEREQYERFRSRAATIFRHRLPDYPAGKKQGSAGSVKGIVYFEPDWTPHFRQPEASYRTPKSWLLAFRTMFQPVFGQLGVDVKVPKASGWKLLMLVVLLVVLIPVGAVLAVLVLMGLIGTLVRVFGN